MIDQVVFMLEVISVDCILPVKIGVPLFAMRHSPTLYRTAVSKAGWFITTAQGSIPTPNSAVERPKADIYIIPVRLEDCDIPKERRPFQ